jgi:aspartate/methionine/tyrosine aminotransferase
LHALARELVADHQHSIVLFDFLDDHWMVREVNLYQTNDSAYRIDTEPDGAVVIQEMSISQLGKVIEFNTSCAPPFVQRAGLVAVNHGESSVQQTVARLHASRDMLVAALAAVPGVEIAPPPGAMYLFFRIAGHSDDSVAIAKQLVAEAGLGLAPGAAFGPEGEGYLRWCFAASSELLTLGASRLAGFLAR